MADNKTIIHCCIDREVYDMLMAHCKATGQTKTTAVKRAIKKYCAPKTAEQREKEGDA